MTRTQRQIHIVGLHEAKCGNLTESADFECKPDFKLLFLLFEPLVISWHLKPLDSESPDSLESELSASEFSPKFFMSLSTSSFNWLKVLKSCKDMSIATPVQDLLRTLSGSFSTIWDPSRTVCLKVKGFCDFSSADSLPSEMFFPPGKAPYGAWSPSPTSAVLPFESKPLSTVILPSW